MRLFFVISLLLSMSAFAKDTVLKFNDALIDQIHKDVNDEVNDGFQKKSVLRGPASVQPDTQSAQEDQKFEKMNIKQIGPNKW